MYSTKSCRLCSFGLHRDTNKTQGESELWSCAAQRNINLLEEAMIGIQSLYRYTHHTGASRMRASEVHICASGWKEYHHQRKVWRHPLQLALVVVSLPATGANTSLALMQLPLCGYRYIMLPL